MLLRRRAKRSNKETRGTRRQTLLNRIPRHANQKNIKKGVILWAMTPEKTISLKGKYPRLFENGITFDCGDGWYDILDSALLVINQHISISSNFNEAHEKTKVTQIKEKFGKLKIQFNTNDDYIYGVTNLVAHISSNYCEVCGSRGEHRSGNERAKTLCDYHQNEHLKTITDPNQTTMFDTNGFLS